MSNTSIWTLLVIAVLLSSVSPTMARVIEIKQARAVIEGAKSLAFEVTLRYNGNERMRNRLIEGKYLRLNSVRHAFMDDDLLIDDKLENLGESKDVFLTPVVKRDDETILWDVTAQPELSFRREFDVTKTTLTQSNEGLFRHEVINGKTSWGGRLHRNELADSHRDDHPIAGLAVIDFLYMIVRGIRGAGIGLATTTTGQDFYTPDFLSNADFYFIVDFRLKDSLNYTYRSVFETKPLTLPNDLSTIEVGEGDASYEENGRTVERAPGFNDLTQ